jgi:molybdenum cofactor biosynthesis enzyme MoaA
MRLLCLQSEIDETHQASARAMSIAGKRYTFRVIDDPTGFCWNMDRRRVRVDSKLNHCMITRLKKSDRQWKFSVSEH